MRPQFWVFSVSFLGMLSLFASREAFFMVRVTQVKNFIHEENGFSSSFLGLIDFLFLFSYSMGFFICGEIGEKMPAAALAGLGLFGTGATYTLIAVVCLEGNVSHTLYSALWVAVGVSQSAVWVGNVKLMSSWFPPHGRGVLFGIWVTSCSVGNILGELLSAVISEELHLQWEWIAFITSTFTFCAALLLLTVESDPDTELLPTETEDLSSPLLEKEPGCCEAVSRPSVRRCMLGLCCVKWMNFGLAMWLPFFFESEWHLDLELAGGEAAALDVGCIIGSLLGGWLTDQVQHKSSVVIGLLLCASPVLLLFPHIPSDHPGVMFFLVLWLGVTVSSSSNMLFPVMATDASQGPKGADPKVLGLIFGFGTLTCAVGQAVIGWLIQFGWTWVFSTFFCKS